jgi:glutathione S-transferase
MLRDYLNITYRKIPILAIGKEVYIDTSLICEALEHHFPASQGWGPLYPPNQNGKSLQSLVRGVASFWTDRPLFRVTTGLIPASVWRSSFGKDREGLIGHKIDPAKLEKKVPQNLSGLDLHLSLLESLTAETNEEQPWLLGTPTPGMADISFFYQLEWGQQMARGEGISNLTAGGAVEGDGEGAHSVFNIDRYPYTWKWFQRTKKYFDDLPLLERKVKPGDTKGLEKAFEFLDGIKSDRTTTLISTPAPQHKELDERHGLILGVQVEVTPDDTGRWNPSRGYLEALSPEEIVITPQHVSTSGQAIQGVRLHFPRIGFVVRPVTNATKL